MYELALDTVEDTFVRYPIPLLQVVGGQLVPFHYHADWEEGTTVSSLRRRNSDRVRLLPGVADRLVVLGPMLRPLIELHWTSDVARWTGVNLEDEALRTHLFGRERVAFPGRLVGGIRDLQDGNCFYCGDRIRGRVSQRHREVHQLAIGPDPFPSTGRHLVLPPRPRHAAVGARRHLRDHEGPGARS